MAIGIGRPQSAYLDREDPSRQIPGKIPKGLTEAALREGGALAKTADDGQTVLCITPAQFEKLPNGTWLQFLHPVPRFHTMQKKGTWNFDQVDPSGVIPYGFTIPDTTPKAVVGRVGAIADKTAAETKTLNA